MEHPDGPGGERTTLADLARLSGTSVPTVSKVLNGRSDVSVATRTAVMASVAATGYRPTRRRARPPLRRTPPDGLVDLVLSAVEGSWANHALSGVEEAAADAGLDVVVTLARERKGADWVHRLLSRRSFGAVLALLTPTPVQLAGLAAANIPVVLLDPSAPPGPDVSSVGAMNWSGGRAAAEHLLGLGHRQVAVITGRRSALFSQARVDGFRSAFEQAGVGTLQIRHGDWSTPQAQALTVELLDAERPPTAVFACSDRMALGVVREAAGRGLTVPDDLSVIGFDDLPESRWVTPGLTTIRQPIRAMGAAALRALLRIQASEDVVVREELATELVVRDSTARPLADRRA